MCIYVHMQIPAAGGYTSITGPEMYMCTVRGGRGRRRRRKVYSKLTKRTERKVGRERENGLAGGMCLCMCVRARTLPFMTLCVSTDPVSRAVQKITKPLAGFAAVGAVLPGSGVQFDRAESLVLFCTNVL